MDKAPNTLQEAVIHFASYDNCHEFMMNLRWPNGKVQCPRCGSDNVSYLPNARVFKCYEKHAQQKFSLKVGTIFEDSPLALDKWLPVMWMIVNCKNGISVVGNSSRHRRDPKDRMVHAAAFPPGDAGRSLSGGKLGGEVEVDETFIGGKARNMHKARKRRAQVQGNGGSAARSSSWACWSAAARSRYRNRRPQEAELEGVIASTLKPAPASTPTRAVLRNGAWPKSTSMRS